MEEEEEEEEDRRELYRRICVNLCVALAVCLFIVFGVPPLIRFFMPLLVAWGVSMIANPIIHFLEKRIRLMRKHGTALVIVLVLAVICAVFYGAGVLVASQFTSWVAALPEIYDSIVRDLDQLIQTLQERFRFIPVDIQGLFDRRENALDDYIRAAINGMMEMVDSSSISRVGSLASSLMDFIVYAVLVILASYFITVEREQLSAVVRENTPSALQELWQRVKDIFVRAIGGYFRAHFKIMIVIFFITVIPFAFMGISYGGLLAAVIAIVDFLPVFGAGTILIPWALYRFITGSYRYAVILIVLYLVILIVRQLLEPKLIGDSIGTSPFQTLIFMFFGYRLAGMGGLILSIPAGMILVECYREGMFESYIRGLQILVRDINEYRKY